MVETALVLPILLLLFMGMVQFGLILFAEATTAWATREYARQIVVEDPSTAVSKSAITASVVADPYKMIPSLVTTDGAPTVLQVNFDSPNTGDVTVVAAGKIVIFVPLLNLVFPNGKFVLNNKTVMRLNES